MKGRRLAIAWVYLVCGLLQALIGLRVLLRLLGALAEEQPANAIYPLSEPLVAPFAGILPDWHARDHILETHSLLALVITVLAAYLCVHVLRLQIVKRERE